MEVPDIGQTRSVRLELHASRMEQQSKTNTMDVSFMSLNSLNLLEFDEFQIS